MSKFVQIATCVLFACQLALADEGETPKPDHPIDASRIKVVAFDVFGTVFDFSEVKRSQIKDYVEHVKSDEWKPLWLPDSWMTMPTHPDAVRGIAAIRKKYVVVTLSNGPMRSLVDMSRNARINWDAIVPIEMAKVYKPKLESYRSVMKLFHCHPSEVLMVTANPLFGDIEAANEIDMQSVVIRQPGQSPADIIELAKMLGCEVTE